MKRCTKCKEEKELLKFKKRTDYKHLYRSHCILCDKKQKRNYYNKNKIRILDGQKQFRLRNKDRVRSRKQKWKQKKMKSSPIFKTLKRLRTRMAYALKGKQKTANTMALLGCTVEDLRSHLQSQFTEGMTWENRGKVWHIDHLLPCASFDLNDPEQQRRCFHYTNLQPLFAFDNMSKGEKNIYGPYMKWESGQWHININGEYMSRSRMVEERIPIQYFYPIEWMISKYNA